MNPHGRVAIGIDVGTSSVKVTALAEDGSVRAASSAPYPISRPIDDAAEQDPAHWWSAVLEAATEVVGDLERAGVAIGPRTTTIGLTGQMHTSVLLGADGEIVHPSILWSDKRATAECALLLDRVSDYERITGNVPMPAFTVTHLMWLRDQAPDVFASIRGVLNPKDEIRRRLGAGLATEPADASGTGLMNTHSGGWSSVIAEAAGISLDLMAPFVSSHTVTGVVTPGFDEQSDALLTRLAGVPVVGGGGDQSTQAVALGVTAPGALGLSLGTSGVAFMALDASQAGSFRHAYEGRWLALDSTHAAGLSLSWIASVIGLDVAAAADGARPADDAPIFLPYLVGHRNAGLQSGAPGSFVGIEAGHNREQLVFAVMEGVAMELLRLAKAVSPDREIVTDDGQVHLGGGGGRSPLWRQLIADVFDRPVTYLDRDSSFGAAAIAAETSGWFSAFEASGSANPLVALPRSENRGAVRARMAAFEEYATRLAG